MVEPINQWGSFNAVQRYASVYRLTVIHQLPENKFPAKQLLCFLTVSAYCIMWLQLIIDLTKLFIA